MKQKSTLLLSVLACMVLTSTAMADRSIVVDPSFVADDSWLLVKVRNDGWRFSSETPSYVAHLFHGEGVFTPLPATAQFWLPKERPHFTLQIQPSGSELDYSRHSLAQEINALADEVMIINGGRGRAMGTDMDFYTYISYQNGQVASRRELITRNVPEPSTLVIALSGLSLFGLRSKIRPS